MPTYKTKKKIMIYESNVFPRHDLVERNAVILFI